MEINYSKENKFPILSSCRIPLSKITINLFLSLSKILIKTKMAYEMFVKHVSKNDLWENLKIVLRYKISFLKHAYSIDHSTEHCGILIAKCSLSTNKILI